MIRQEAFIDAKKHLKGALHCHTTRSDGQGAPEDVIRLHKENGYDFMALTDHRIYNYKNFAPDVDITIIPGTEVDRSLTEGCHHFVSIGPERERGNGFAQDQTFEGGKLTDPADGQALLDMLHENNNLTIYCHPEWSGVTLREFGMLRGNFAMEIWNSSAVIENGLDSNAAYWDEWLDQGVRIFGVATDDGHPVDQHCRGWVRVNSENSVSAILDALKRGAFYASNGPEIHDFYVEDGVAHVKCSPVQNIAFRCLRQPYACVTGENITEGSARVSMKQKYIRAIVTDAEGRRAWTNPIFYQD